MVRGIRKAVMGVLVLQSAALLACHDGNYVRNVYATAVFDQAALDFGEVPVGEWREKEITVRNVGYVPFRLVEALKLDDNPSYVVEAPQTLVPSGETRTVKVKFHPLREGDLATQVRVETDARVRPVDPLPVHGIGTPAQVVLSPSNLDFETLEVDSDRTLEVSIGNPVDIPLSVSLKGVDAAEFSADSFTIPPNSTVHLKATYHPSSVGNRTASIDVLACGDCTPTQVALTGRAVPSAFEFKPAPVPFQETPVHESTKSWTKMTNVTWRPVKVLETVTSDQAFSTMSDLRERTVQPGETVQVDMQFAARFSGPNLGSMDVSYLSDKQRKSQVLLDARGGQPQLALTPIDIDFGKLPKGGKADATVRLTNAGTNGDLHLTGVHGSGAFENFSVGTITLKDGRTFEFTGNWPDPVAPDVPIKPGDDYADVKVYFNPTAIGDFQGAITFQTDAIFNATRDVHVKGSAFDPGVCKWRVLPNPVEFGNVPPGTEAILGFRFENAGTDICAVKDIHISNDGGGVFSMPGGALTGGVVLKDDAFSAMIRFSANTPGTYQGELELTVNDPQTPTIKVPLLALAAPSCLVATPSPLDFGPIRYDCAPQGQTTFISNQCATPVTVNNVEVGPGTSNQYHENSPPLPLTLNPGEGFEVEVTYDRTVLGQHYSPLWVHVAGEPTPYVIPLWAETNHEGTATDTFVQGQSKQLDVLFVVSNTTTMQTWQQRLQSAIPGFLQDAAAQGMSMQVGVTTTGLVDRSPACGGGANGGEAGRLFPVDGTRQRILQGVPTSAAALEQNIDVGTCHNLAQGLEAMRMALSSPLIDHTDDTRTPQPNDGNAGFLRPSARLAVVFLADEDDHSGFTPTSYTRFLQSLKGPNQGHRTQAYALVPDSTCAPGATAGPDGARYAAVAQGTGGAAASICSSSYANLLGQVLARAAGPQADFKLSFPAAGAADITVFVDGAQVPAGNWSFNANDNSVVFNSGHIPAPGQVIEVKYVSQCGVVTQ